MLRTPKEIAHLAERGYQGVERLLALAPRAIALLDEAEQLLTRADALVARIEKTNQRARLVVSEAETVLAQTTVVVAQAAALTDQVTPLVVSAEPALERLLPLLDQVGANVTAEDAAAIIRLINDLPDIVGKLDRDILPVLDTLGTVAPDLRDLLDVSKDLNELLAALPGLGRVKRRLDNEEGDTESVREYLADEEPPSAPDRGHKLAIEAGDA